MTYLLPVERALYFDSNTFVRGSLKELWEVDLQGQPVGAVMHRHQLSNGPQGCQESAIFQCWNDVDRFGEGTVPEYIGRKNEGR